MQVAVVGGGITGLAAAWQLRDHDVVVLESSERVGGKIRTGEVDGVQVEFGADAFLTDPPDAVALAEEVGLGEDLASPATSGVSIWRGSGLRQLPEGVVLGAPTRLGPLLRSGLLSPFGVARAGLDLVLPPTGGTTVGQVVGRRFGREVVERLVDPLLGGVYAGDPDHLDAVAATPVLAGAATADRSLLLGLRRRRSRPPSFRTVVGGLGRLVGALDARLEVRTRWPVTAIEPAWGDRWVVHGPATLEVDAIVLTTPAYVTAQLLRGTAPTAAAALAEIEYASVALVALVYPEGSGRLRGSGMLVPSAEPRTVKAATWMSSKWDHVGGGRVVVRASVGRHGDTGALALDDEALVAAVTRDLEIAVDLPRDPDAAAVVRWDRALPQYGVGHLDRVAAVEASLPRGVVVAGAALRGIGIPACVRQGREAGLTLERSLPRA